MAAMNQNDIKALADGDIVWGLLRYRDHDGTVYVFHAGRIDVSLTRIPGEFSAAQLAEHGVSFGWDKLTAGGGFASEDVWLDLYADADSTRAAFATVTAEGARAYGPGWTTDFTE